MAWRKPDDLELVKECESLPELEVLRSLLASEGIDSVALTASEAGAMFGLKSPFSAADPLPYKLLVRPEDAENARMAIEGAVTASEEEDEEV